MSTNNKAVFYHLDQFLRADMTKKGDFLAKHFFNYPMKSKEYEKQSA